MKPCPLCLAPRSASNLRENGIWAHWKALIRSTQYWPTAPKRLIERRWWNCAHSVLPLDLCFKPSTKMVSECIGKPLYAQPNIDQQPEKDWLSTADGTAPTLSCPSISASNPPRKWYLSALESPYTLNPISTNNPKRIDRAPLIELCPPTPVLPPLFAWNFRDGVPRTHKLSPPPSPPSLPSPHQWEPRVTKGSLFLLSLELVRMLFCMLRLLVGLLPT